jgi:hypothetical protein
VYDRLRFRRQFILSRVAIRELNEWQRVQIGDHHLQAHPDLELTEVKDGHQTVVLLGYLFDPAHPLRRNGEIIQEILRKTSGFHGVLGCIRPLAGRYVLMYLFERLLWVLHDPLGLREVYYTTIPSNVICGSQPNLLDTFSDPKLGVTQDRRILDFYERDIKQVRSGRLWVGDETYYSDVKHLLPNHYLDVVALRAARYWPSQRLERISLRTAVKDSCQYLEGVLKAVTSRYEVMMAVTSGIDSRSLLAASRDVKDKVYYFINKQPGLTERSGDIRVPRMMFERLDIPFHVHEMSVDVETHFREVFLGNVFMATELILPTIYNVYYKNHPTKVNLLGVGEIGRDYYGKAPRDVDGYYLARCLRYKNSAYATWQCQKWLDETRGVASACNVDIMKLLLWEGLLGNWGAVGNSESDIAIEEFDPYDSHYIYEIMLSVDPAEGSLFEAMFREMWPELLKFPFNPPEGLSDWVKGLLRRFGLYGFLQRQLYRIDRWRALRGSEEAT